MTEQQFEISSIDYIADAFLGWNNQREVDYKLQAELIRTQTYLILSPHLTSKSITPQKLWPMGWDKQPKVNIQAIKEAFAKMPDTLPKQ